MQTIPNNAYSELEAAADGVDVNAPLILGTPQHQAYAQSDAHFFCSKPLKPFSPKHQMAAQAIGLRLWSLTPEEIAAATLTRTVEGREVTSFVYDGLYFDAVLIVYLCQCPDSDVARAMRLPGEIRAKVLQWAEDEKITLNSSKFEGPCAPASERSSATFPPAPPRPTRPRSRRRPPQKKA
jgi:hypothetical protein